MKKGLLIAEGRNAALFNPNVTCPYHKFAEIVAWKKGFDKGAEETDRLSWDELAFARGWHAGFYAPTSSVCPYENGDEIRYWQHGFATGHTASGNFNETFGKRQASDPMPSLPPMATQAGQAAPAPIPVPTKTPRFATKGGRTATEVTNSQEIERIRKAYRGNGGNLSYSQIEKKFGLRQSRGTNAWRIVNLARC